MQLPSVIKSLQLPDRGTQISPDQQGESTALCLSCTVMSNGSLALHINLSVLRGPQCAVGCRVTLSTHLWGGAAGTIDLPDPQLVSWEGWRVTCLFYGQDLMLSQQWDFYLLCRYPDA